MIRGATLLRSPRCVTKQKTPRRSRSWGRCAKVAPISLVRFRQDSLSSAGALGDAANRVKPVRSHIEFVGMARVLRVKRC